MDAPGWLAALAAAAGGLTAAATVVKLLGLDKLASGARAFFADWFGEPARPGRDALPSFPERMSRVEQRSASIEHFVRGDLTSRLELVRLHAEESRGQARENHDALLRVEERVTDHRRRNEAQVELLREAIADQLLRLDRIERDQQHQQQRQQPDERTDP